MFLIGLGGLIVAGLLTGLSGLANSGVSHLSNKALQEDAQEHQLYMSNTAYQRGIADMKAAGLNPNLLLNNGGAAVSGSSSSNSGVKADLTSAITNYAVNSALSKQNYEQQLWLQNDKQAFLREMANNKVNSGKTYNYTYSKDIKDSKNSDNFEWFDTL